MPIEFRKPDSEEEDEEEEEDLFSNPLFEISQFDWLPTHPALLVKLKGQPKLRRIELDGCKPVQSIARLPPIEEFSVSPDGIWVAYRPGGKDRSLVLRRMGSPPEQKPVFEICSEEWYCRDVKWHPQGTQMAFWRTRPKVSAGYEVAVVGFPSAGRRLNTLPEPFVVSQSAHKAGERDSRRPALAASYSPTGTHLAYVSGGQIFVVETDPLRKRKRDGVRQLKSSGVDSDKSDLAWIDPHNVAFILKDRGRFPIAIANIVHTQRRAKVLGGLDINYDLAITPVDRRLAFSAYDAQQSIMVAPVTRKRLPAVRKVSFYLTVTSNDRSKKIGSTGANQGGRSGTLELAFDTWLQLDATQPQASSDLVRLSLVISAR